MTFLAYEGQQKFVVFFFRLISPNKQFYGEEINGSCDMYGREEKLMSTPEGKRPLRKHGHRLEKIIT